MKSTYTHHAVIVVPTYNERENILNTLRKIIGQQSAVPRILISVLVVDDNSPDGTGQLVTRFAKRHPQIHLLRGVKQGLGAAYIRGFNYALKFFKPDLIVEMDADGSHDPAELPRMLQLASNGADVVIGSRYISGGSIPPTWPRWRRWNSHIANWLARFLTDLSEIQDCSGGFRAIKVVYLRQVDFSQLNSGYVFQICLLHQLVTSGAKVVEIPIQFADRTFGESKLRLKDIFGFVLTCLQLAVITWPSRRYFIAVFIFGLGLGVTATVISLTGWGIVHWWLTVGVFVSALVLTAQSLFTLVWMLYAWNDPDQTPVLSNPKLWSAPRLGFTAIVPVRHEEKVIADTLAAVDRISYPRSLTQTIVVCRADDHETILAARMAIKQLRNPTISLTTFDDYPINKPHGLNVALAEVRHPVTVVFDAEDEPNPNIYRLVNSGMIQKSLDVIQCGVQLMNWRSGWWSALNVLEYFFWYKSALPLFVKLEVAPLGGNTVFFKTSWLRRIGGWDEQCLTEDADIGIRLSLAGAKIGTIYDERYSTQEETPANIGEFIKQRTRWNQGFLQILGKTDWQQLPSLRQKLLVGYLLIWPIIQASMTVGLLVAAVSVAYLRLPVIVTMFTYIPFYILGLQIIILQLGLWEFVRAYRLVYPWWTPLWILVLVWPYQILLTISAGRAMIRLWLGELGWEKTLHLNAHRIPVGKAVA